MNEQAVHPSVNRRNIHALAEAAKQERGRTDNLTTEVRGLRNEVTRLRAELTTLQQQVAVLLSQTGRGPTSR